MFRDSYVSLITPFNQDQTIDWACFERIIDDHLDQGSSGFFLATEIGEGLFLTLEEKLKMAEKASSFCSKNALVFLEVFLKEMIGRSQFFDSILAAECAGVVINLSDARKEDELLDVFVALSNYKTPLILKGVQALSKRSLEQLAALPYVHATHQSLVDVYPKPLPNLKQYVEYDRGLLRLSSDQIDPVVSFAAHLFPKGHALIAQAGESSFKHLMGLKKLAELMQLFVDEDKTSLIKAFLADQNARSPYLRKKRSEVNKDALAKIKNKVQELKNV